MKGAESVGIATASIFSAMTSSSAFCAKTGKGHGEGEGSGDAQAVAAGDRVVRVGVREEWLDRAASR